jgi:CBS domain containing-hemolysin-like protein
MDEPASSFLALFLSGEPANLSVTLLKLFSVLILVAVNGFFVAAEFALVGVRRSRIETLAATGHSAAKRLLRVLDNLNSYLSASQLGITLASLGLGWVGEPAFAALLEGPLNGTRLEQWKHPIAFVIAFLIITALHIVLGEQAPKLIGLDRAEKVALATAWPMEMFYKIGRPFIHALDWASARVVRLFGIHATAEHASAYTQEELRQIIARSHQSGHLGVEEQQLLDRVFEFSDTQVREAMVPRTEVAALPDTSALEEIAQAFKEHGYSRLPVYGESLDDVKGFIHSKDLMPYLLQPKAFKLSKVIKPAFFVVDTARLEDVLRQMQRDKFHFGFVVDEHGGVEGILTLEDLLEEIVGDISDEHDDEVNEQIAETPDGAFMLDGGVAVRDLNRRLQLDLPESEAYTTIAGFLMDTAGQLLEQGETVEYNGLTFHIEEVERRRIRRVRLVKPAPETVDEPAAVV